MNNHYDIIITGAGCAGLSMAHYLSKSEFLQNKKVLLLDYAQKNQNDRTWCFWTEYVLDYACAQRKSWRNLVFWGRRKSADKFKNRKVDNIAPYEYIHISGQEFYEEVLTEIRSLSNFTFRVAKVESIEPNAEKVVIEIIDGTYTTDYVFNSIPRFQSRVSQKHLTIKQHFVGLVIETEQNEFDDSEALLMDFRIQQKDQVRFFYVLPFTKNKALVEFTIFSDQLLYQSEYKQGIESYITNCLGIENYTIVEEERGVIPMSNAYVEVQPHKRVFNLGIAGGMTKPTTGYTFRNIQMACQHIIYNWEQNSQPSWTHFKTKRFLFYDNLLLHIIKHESTQVQHIMEQLFTKNKFKKVLKFLDEDTSLLEEIQLFFKLPLKPFLKAIYYVYLQPRFKTRKIKSWRRKWVGNTPNT